MTASHALNHRPIDAAERYSGHESFACRYGWLIKIYRLVLENPQQFQNLDDIMLALGLGKNMAKSLRFWAGAFDLVADTSARTISCTPFADWLLDPEAGVDSYLEDPRSLWLLHWRVTAMAGLGAWQLLFFETPETEMLRSRVSERLAQRAASTGRPLAANTLKQHIDIFLSTYASRPARSANVLEHVLACPLQELALVERRPHGRADELIALPRTDRRGVDALTLARIVCDYWRVRAPHDRTVSLASLLLDVASPGLVLRMEEGAFVERISDMADLFPRVFRYSHGVERQSLTCLSDSLSDAVERLEYV